MTIYYADSKGDEHAVDLDDSDIDVDLTPETITALKKGISFTVKAQWHTSKEFWRRFFPFMPSDN